MYDFNYSFNIVGNASSVAQQITGDVTALNNTVSKATGIWDSFAGKIVVFNQLSQFVDGFSRTVEQTLAPGAALNASLADLSAISDVTGDKLKMIEQYARDTAKAFGGPASQSVESYKLLLGQLSPELAKYPEALKAMGDNVATLSKTMGGDATAAAEVLTTAMNQYGVSLDDPMEASRKMAEMMNVMAAAGKEGSAELPTIKTALEQCGMAAEAAGVSFEETNAAIQVLDKAGKKGAEGGVALRNVMNTLSKGRFLPKVVLEELQAAGVDVQTLTDKSLSLTERLVPLKGVMNDTALFTKLFGVANANAGMALVQGIDDVKRYTEAITGTNTAYDQAATIMDSYNERKARVQARFEDFKISVFNATGNFGIWVETVANSLVPISQLMPLITGVGQAMTFVKNINFANVFASMGRMCTVARLQMTFLNHELRTGQMASLGFTGSLIRATLATGRFATVGLLSGVKALGAWILSLVTGGAASVGFAGVASGAFATFKIAAVTACRAVSAAITSIPIIGWIAGAVSLAIFAISKLRGKAAEAHSEMKNFAAEATMEIDREKRALDDLYGAAVNAAAGSRERAEVINAINEKYGQYLPNLLTEKSTNEDIATALRLVNTELTNNIKLKYRQQEAERIYAAEQEATKAVIDDVTRKIADWQDLEEVSAETQRKVAEAIVEFNHNIKENIYGEDARGAIMHLSLDLQRLGFITENGFFNPNPTKRSRDKLTGYVDDLVSTLKQGRREEAQLDALLGEITPGTLGTTTGGGKIGDDGGGGSITNGLAGVGGSTDKTDKIKNIHVTIDRLIDKFEIHTTNLHEDVSKVKEMVAEALISAVNDVNYAM